MWTGRLRIHWWCWRKRDVLLWCLKKLFVRPQASLSGCSASSLHGECCRKLRVIRKNLQMNVVMSPYYFVTIIIVIIAVIVFNVINILWKSKNLKKKTLINKSKYWRIKIKNDELKYWNLPDSSCRRKLKVRNLSCLRLNRKATQPSRQRILRDLLENKDTNESNEENIWNFKYLIINRLWLIMINY